MLYEIVLAVFMVVTMGKIAEADDQSPILWGAVALLLGILCLLFVPYTFARVLLAAVLTYVAMTVYKMITDK